MRNDTKMPDGFGNLAKNILFLIFAYLPTQGFQVNHWWRAAFIAFELLCEQEFSRKFPEIYATMQANDHRPRDWREEMFWLTQYASEFPERFRKIKVSRHFVENWKKAYQKARESFESHLKHCNPVHSAIAQGHTEELQTALDAAYLDIGPEIDFNLDLLFFGPEVSIWDFCLLFKTPNYTQPISELIWKFIKTKANAEEWLPWAIMTFQSAETMESLIQSREDFRDLDDLIFYDSTLLELSCEVGSPEITTLLLDRGMKVNREDNDGVTPLHIACRNANVAVVKVLIDRKADVEKRDHGRESPLLAAISSGDSETVALILSRTLNLIEEGKYNDDALSRACSEGYVEIVKLLFEHRARISFDPVDINALKKIAALQGHLEVVTYLFEISDEEEIESSLFHAACEGGNLHLVKLILGHKALVALSSDEIFYAFGAACYRGHLIVARLLAGKIKDDEWNKDVPIYDFTPLTLACHSENLELIAFLLTCPVDINAKGSKKVSALEYALSRAKYVAGQYLISRGAKVDIKNDHNLIYSISWALGSAKLEMASALLNSSPAVIFKFLNVLEGHCKPESRSKGIYLLERMAEGILICPKMAYRKYLRKSYSFCITPICENNPDLLLLFAMITEQPLEEIKRITRLGAPLEGSPKYAVKPMDLAQRFHSVAQVYMRAQMGTLAPHIQSISQLWQPPDIDDRESVNFEEAGSDGNNPKKRSRKP